MLSRLVMKYRRYFIENTWSLGRKEQENRAITRLFNSNACPTDWQSRAHHQGSTPQTILPFNRNIQARPTSLHPKLETSATGEKTDAQKDHTEINLPGEIEDAQEYNDIARGGNAN